MDLKKQAEAFADLLKRHFSDKLVSIVLFGSVGRGDARPDSDIDFLVVLRDLPSGRYLRQISLDPVYDDFAGGGFAASVNCHLKTPQEAKRVTVMYLDFPDDACILFDQNEFFKNIMDEVKNRIKISGAIRKKWGKFYYWDLKPGAKADETFDIL